MGRVRLLWMLTILCFFGWLTRGHAAGFMESGKAVTEATYEDVINKWSNMREKMDDVIRLSMERLNDMMEHEAPSLNISFACTKHVQIMFEEMMDLKIWALHMLDASGKPVGGQLSMSSIFGSREECIRVSVTPSELEGKGIQDPFQGKYCFIDIRPPLPDNPWIYRGMNHVIEPLWNFTAKTEIMSEFKKMAGHVYEIPYRFSICLPTSCDDSDILRIFGLATDTADMDLEIHYCNVKVDEEFQTDHLIIIGVLSSFMGLVFLMSLVDFSSKNYSSRVRYEREKQGLSLGFRHRCVKSFSILSSARSLFSTRLGPNEGGRDDGALSAVHGIRYLAMTWILLAQTAVLMSPYLIRSTKDSMRMFQRLGFQYLISSFLAVDTFFFLSAVLVAYHVVRIVDRKQAPLNVPVLIMKRIWRLLPGAMLMLGLILILPFFNYGPMWNDYFGPSTRDCRLNWWMIPTFTLNIFYPKHKCLKHLWYVSADIQLFLIAMIYLLILFKSPRIGKWFLVIMMGTSVILTATLAYVTESPPSVTGIYSNFDDYMSQHYYMYFLPHVDLCVYAVGLALGTFLARRKIVHIPKLIQAVIWLVSIAAGLTCVYITYFWTNGRIASPAEGTLYTATHRTIWAFVLSWLVLTCATGHAEVTNGLLSWPGFVLLNKQSYMSYLLHYLVLSYFYGAMQGVQDLTGTSLYFYFFANLVSTFVGATVLNLFFGHPLGCIPDLIFGGKQSPQRINWRYPNNLTVSTPALDALTNSSSVRGSKAKGQEGVLVVVANDSRVSNGEIISSEAKGGESKA